MPPVRLKLLRLLLVIALAAPAGCETLTVRSQGPEFGSAPSPGSGVGPQSPGVPTEKDKSTLPTYVLEPPDILLVDAVKLVPKPPYLIEPLDVLQILVVGTLVDQPIAGQFPVDPSGMVDLGPGYGRVQVAKLSLDDAKGAVDKFLRRVLREPEVSVTLIQSSGQQQVAGEHLIAPDGTVNLGTYGRVYVAGMTISQAKAVLERHLVKYLEEPQISVDVLAYNSKVYYVISEGAGLGDSVVRVPATGNETVLDAISQINGLSRLSSKHIWIARPAPGGQGCDVILPVSWAEITKGAATATNYQVLPGDRIFIAEDKLIAMDNFVDRITNPFERILGTVSLGSSTIQVMNRFPLGFQGFNAL